MKDLFLLTIATIITTFAFMIINEAEIMKLRMMIKTEIFIHSFIFGLKPK